MIDTPTDWAINDDAIREAVAAAQGAVLIIGARYICTTEADEDPMAAKLTSMGLSLFDGGQCEIVGSLEVPALESSILDAIARLRRIASHGGYRLQAIEAGDVEGGNATVLASEAGYVPWWRIPTNGS